MHTIWSSFEFFLGICNNLWHWRLTKKQAVGLSAYMAHGLISTRCFAYVCVYIYMPVDWGLAEDGFFEISDECDNDRWVNNLNTVHICVLTTRLKGNILKNKKTQTSSSIAVSCHRSPTSRSRLRSSVMILNQSWTLLEWWVQIVPSF